MITAPIAELRRIFGRLTAERDDALRRLAETEQQCARLRECAAKAAVGEWAARHRPEPSRFAKACAAGIAPKAPPVPAGAFSEAPRGKGADPAPERTRAEDGDAAVVWPLPARETPMDDPALLRRALEALAGEVTRYRRMIGDSNCARDEVIVEALSFAKERP